MNRDASIPNPQTNLNDNFTSPDEWFGTSTQANDPMWRNQEIPTASSIVANYAPDGEGMFFNSTSAVYHGDVVRGILPKGTSFTELDYMTYPDPNGFCWNPASGPWPKTRQPDEIIDWVFGELNPPGPISQCSDGFPTTIRER